MVVIMTDENMVLGHIDALRTEMLSRFGLLLRANAELEKRIIELEDIQADLKMQAELDAIAWCKTHGVERHP